MPHPSEARLILWFVSQEVSPRLTIRIFPKKQDISATAISTSLSRELHMNSISDIKIPDMNLASNPDEENGYLNGMAPTYLDMH